MAEYSRSAWTEEDDRQLYAELQTLASRKQIAEKLRRTEKAVNARVQLMGWFVGQNGEPIEPPRPWTEDDVAQLKALSKQFSTWDEIAKIMKRSVSSVRKKAYTIDAAPERIAAPPKRLQGDTMGSEMRDPHMPRGPVIWPAHVRFDSMKMKPSRGLPIRTSSDPEFSNIGCAAQMCIEGGR